MSASTIFNYQSCCQFLIYLFSKLKVTKQLLLFLAFLFMLPFAMLAQCPLSYSCTDHINGDIEIEFSFDAGNNAGHDNEVACNFIVRTGGALIGGDEEQCSGGSFTIDGITYNYVSRTAGGPGPIVISYTSGVPHAPGFCPATDYTIAEAIGCADTSDDDCLSIIFKDELTGNNCTSSNSYFSMTLEDIGGCGTIYVGKQWKFRIGFLGTSSYTTGTYTTATIKAGTYIFVFTDVDGDETTFIYNHTTRTIDKCPFEDAEVYIDKTITSGDPYIIAGDIVNYQYDVTTDVDISNVTVNDNKIAGGLATYISGDDGDGILETTETWIFTGSYTIQPIDVINGSVTNSAFARGLNGGIDIFSDTDEATATLLPCVTPTITTQPNNQTVCVGDGVSFTVVTDPGTLLTYQWKENGVDLTNSGVHSGVDSTTLSISDATGLNGNTYEVVITESATCSTTSDTVTLTVNDLPIADAGYRWERSTVRP